MSSSRHAYTSSDKPQEGMFITYTQLNMELTNLSVLAGLTKCVARFKNGKKCPYNAKPGRITCDRAGHSDWENLDATPDDKLESQQGDLIKAEDDVNGWKEIEGDESSPGSNTSGLKEPTTIKGKGLKEEEYPRAKGCSSELGDLVVPHGHVPFEQRDSESSGILGEGAEPQLFTLSEDSDGTEECDNAVDRGQWFKAQPHHFSLQFTELLPTRSQKTKMYRSERVPQRTLRPRTRNWLPNMQNKVPPRPRTFKPTQRTEFDCFPSQNDMTAGQSPPLRRQFGNDTYAEGIVYVQHPRSPARTDQ